MKDPLRPDHCARMLGALAAPERLRIVRFLRDHSHTVGEIAEMLGTTAVNTSHHLQVLTHAGITDRRKQGRFVFYSLVPGVMTGGGSAGEEFLNLGCCRLELPQEGKPAGPQ